MNYRYRKYKGDKSMKIFISWSGEVSFQVAKVLKEWIPCIIQDAEPYFSSEDIDKGARWSTDIARELESASFGILCVTKDNLESQWLNFEAGALSKAIDKAKVCPLLFKLKPSDISDSPILQFQMANVQKDDIFKLFKSINASLGESGLDDGRLEKVFETFWPKMNDGFNSIVTSENLEQKKVSKDDNRKILEEMLELLRSQQMLLKNPDKLLPIDYFRDLMAVLHISNESVLGSGMTNRMIMEMQTYEHQIRNLIYKIEDVELASDMNKYFERYVSCAKKATRSTIGVYKLYKEVEDK